VALFKKNRLTSKTEIQKTIRQGQKISLNEIKVFFKKTDQKFSRAVIIIPKKIDKRSAIRNKLRRRAGEVIRKIIPQIKKTGDMVILMQKGAEVLKFQELKEKLISVLRPFV
jgi:ribonuclease P protein component